MRTECHEASIIQYLLEAAGMLGFDVTEEQIRTTAEELNEEQRKATEEAASEVAALSLDDLDAAAGGAGYGSCSDTFEQRENCLSNDGCDKYINDYDNYECLHNNRYHHCSTIDSIYCVNAFIPFKSR